MESLARDDVHWALTSGRQRLADLAGADPLDAYEVVTRLRGDGLTAGQARAVVDLASGSAAAWRAGQPRTTHWTRAGAEQASDPVVARWRARRFAARDAIDLTAGCGGDSLALADVALGLTSVELDDVRVEILRHNLGARASVVHGHALRVPVSDAAWWADPSRRVDGRRRKSLGAVVPSVPALIERWGRGAAGVAVSPGTDLDDPDLPDDAELEFVQVGSRLVEAALWLGDLRAPPSRDGGGERSTVTRSATLLPSGMHERGTPVSGRLPIATVGTYLLDPVPALVRARLHETVGERFGAWRIARTRALLSAAEPADTPWFVAWEVEAVLSPHVRSVRRHLQSLDDDLPLEIALHGIDADVDAWHRALGAPRGPDGRRLHLVRTDEGGIGVLCRRVPGPPTGES